MPLSTLQIAPCTLRASSEARNRITAAMSSGAESGRGTMGRLTSSMSTSSGNARFVTIGVSVPPGATALMRTPLFRYSTAIARVRFTIPPLLAQ
jgi:hypothetical protein